MVLVVVVCGGTPELPTVLCQVGAGVEFKLLIDEGEDTGLVVVWHGAVSPLLVHVVIPGGAAPQFSRALPLTGAGVVHLFVVEEGECTALSWRVPTQDDIWTVAPQLILVVVVGCGTPEMSHLASSIGATVK